MSQTVYYLLAVLVTAVATYIPRALPFALFRKPVQSRFIRSFLEYMPVAVLAVARLLCRAAVFASSVVGTTSPVVTPRSVPYLPNISLVMTWISTGRPKSMTTVSGSAWGSQTTANQTTVLL